VKRTIFDISNDMAALDAVLHECGGDLSDPNADQILQRWEEELESDLHGKLDDYCGLIRELEARAEARKAEADRIAELASKDRKTADNLRERLRFIFDLRGLPTQQTSRFRISLARNGGKAPLDLRAEPDDETLPDWAVQTKTVKSFDKDAIRAALERGEALSFARLLERGNRIAIK
jgi:hypothetical protein